MSIASNTPLPTLLLAALVTLAMAGCAVSLDLNDDTTRRIRNDTVPVTGLAGVDITTDNGQIEVVHGAADDIEIRTVLQEADEGDAEYSIETSDDRLVLVGECDARWWNNCSVGFRVVVPAGFDVAAATDNGRIGVESIAGALDLTTDNGAIEATGVDAPTVRAHTDNGRIVLSFDTAPERVDAETDNGAIAIRVPDDGTVYDVDAASDNGDVDVDVRASSDAERQLVARSDNGSVDVEYRAAGDG